MKLGTVAVMAAGTVCFASLFLNTRPAAAQASPERLVRIAELEIDPGQLEAYKHALREEIEATIRIEAGVLTLYAVSVKGQPNQIRLFEVYADTAAYQAHLQSAHFLRYKSQTALMVRSLKLIETEPVLLGAK
jgi:quinol monooxygenase YgiN